MNNNQNTSYYGSDKRNSLSYLEFGSIDMDHAKKTIWAYRQDQEAYDMYMFSRYAKDLFLFRDFFNESQRDLTALNAYITRSAHDKILDYIFKYAGTIAYINKSDKTKHSNLRVCESGSSLFGFIEEVAAFDLAVADGANVEMIKSLKYLGSDISEMMNRGAEVMHPGLDMIFSTADTVAKLLDEQGRIGLFYGLSVSLRYALRTDSDVLKIAQNSELAMLNRISMSRGIAEEVIAGTGKSAYIMSLPELKKLFADNGIIAEFTTDNMQIDRDGKDTVRASLIISRDERYIDDFKHVYDACIVKAIEAGLLDKRGSWHNISEL